MADEPAEQAVAPAAADPDARPAVRAQRNTRALRDRARQALAANATFLGLGTPTVLQNAAQVRALTRQVNALARLVLADQALEDDDQ